MRLDLLIASASAGLLVYSGRLLVPTARLRPEDIIATAYFPTGESAYTLRPEDVPFPVFPEYGVVLDIRDILESKIGLVLLVAGTIGGVLATIAGAIRITWESLQGPSNWDYLEATAAFASAIVVSWWTTTRSGWRCKQETRLLVHCFLLWLERAVGDPKAEGAEFGLTVISTARTSGCTLMGDLLVPVGIVRTEPEDKAAARRIVTLAREHRYRRRRDDFRKWASEVSAKNG